jgi:hypothetical protein
MATLCAVRDCEERSDAATQRLNSKRKFSAKRTLSGLLRFARNDGLSLGRAYLRKGRQFFSSGSSRDGLGACGALDGFIHSSDCGHGGRNASSTSRSSRLSPVIVGAIEPGTDGLRLFKSRAAALAAAARAAFGSNPSMKPGRSASPCPDEPGAAGIALAPGAPSPERGLGRVTDAPRGALEPALGDAVPVEGDPDDAGAALDALGAALAAGAAAAGEGAAVVNCGGADAGVGAATAGAGGVIAAAGGVTGVGGVGAVLAGSAAAAFGGSGVAGFEGSGVTAFVGSGVACFVSVGGAGVGATGAGIVSTTSRFGGVISIGGAGFTSTGGGVIGCGTAIGACLSTRVGATGSGSFAGVGATSGGVGIVTVVRGNSTSGGGVSGATGVSCSISCFGTTVTVARSVGAVTRVIGSLGRARSGSRTGVGCSGSIRGCKRARNASPEVCGVTARKPKLSPPS